MYKDPSLTAYNSFVRSLNSDCGYYTGRANGAGRKKKKPQSTHRDEIKVEPDSIKRTVNTALAFT